MMNSINLRQLMIVLSFCSLTSVGYCAVGDKAEFDCQGVDNNGANVHSVLHMTAEAPDKFNTQWTYDSKSSKEDHGKVHLTSPKNMLEFATSPDGKHVSTSHITALDNNHLIVHAKTFDAESKQKSAVMGLCTRK